jgi:hypothetical protein
VYDILYFVVPWGMMCSILCKFSGFAPKNKDIMAYYET